MPRKSMWVYLGGRCMVHTYSKIPASPTCYVLRAESTRQAMYAPRGLRLAMILLAAAAWGAARADIYSFVDASGVTHLSNVPVDTRYRLLLATPVAERPDPPGKYLARSADYDPMIERAARAAALRPELVRAVIVVESAFNPRAVSKRGAQGLMQLQPSTARRYQRLRPGAEHHRRRALPAGPPAAIRQRSRAHPRGLQRGRGGGGAVRPEHSALLGDPSLRPGRAARVPKAPRSAAQELMPVRGARPERNIMRLRERTAQ